MERLLFVLLCAVLAWSPLPLGSNRGWSVSLLELLIALLFAGWLSRLNPGTPLPAALTHSRPVILLFFLIPLWTALQLVPLPPELLHALSPHASAFHPDQAWHCLSLEPEATLLQLQRSLAYALFFVLSLGLITTPARLEQVAQVIVISGVFQASYGMLVATGGKNFDLLGISAVHGVGSDGDQGGHTATGTFVNRNHLAGYLEMTIAVGVGLLITHISHHTSRLAGWRARLREFVFTLLSGKARLRVFLAVMVVALVLTHSRMGNTAFFTSLGLSGLIGLALYRRHPKAKSFVLLFASLLIIDMFIVGAWFGLDTVAERLEKTDAAYDPRAFVFERAWLAVQDYWMTGSGAGTFHSVFAPYKDNRLYGYYDFAHNDFLQIAIEYGVIGFICFGLIVLYCFAQALQAQRLRKTAILKGAGFGAMMGIISLMIHSSVDFNLQIPANAMLFTLLCAFACVARSMERQPSRHHSKSSDVTTPRRDS